MTAKVGRFSYKDPYFLPPNTFKRKPREYYAARTTYKLPEHLKPILEEYLKKPQPRLNKYDYCICCYRGGGYRSKEQENLSNFIMSILPDRRADDWKHAVYLVKRPKGFTKTFALNRKTKDRLLPLIFEAIEKGTL